MADNTYKLFILDRDGVINEDSPHYITSPDMWHPIAGSLTAIAKLNKAGIKVVVATNQSAVGRGLMSVKKLDEIHAKFKRELAKVGGFVDGIFYCLHHPDANCMCRKPKHGLLQQIFAKFNIAPMNSLVVGDSLRDIKAAFACNAHVALVKTGNGARTLRRYRIELDAVPVFANFAAVVEKYFARLTCKK